jgi:aryl-alcohol dehydrogenase-like predicted oxidoreductase
MKRRKFGRTGLDVSELVFGGGKVGGILIYKDDDTKRTVIRRALDGGIYWIDTAPKYGDGKSEEALGRLLDEIDVTPYLSTKVQLDTSRLDGWCQTKIERVSKNRPSGAPQAAESSRHSARAAERLSLKFLRL